METSKNGAMSARPIRDALHAAIDAAAERDCTQSRHMAGETLDALRIAFEGEPTGEALETAPGVAYAALTVALRALIRACDAQFSAEIAVARTRFNCSGSSLKRFQGSSGPRSTVVTTYWS